MYFNSIKIAGIRSIDSLKLDFTPAKRAGWHVLLGDNGTGKSTILRCMALSLVGKDEMLRLNPNWNAWIQKGQKKGEISAIFDISDWFSPTQPDSSPTPLSKEKEIKEEERNFSITNNTVSYLPLKKTSAYRLEEVWDSPDRNFSASFGAYRRFVGGNLSLEQNYKTNPLIGAHLSLFQEDVALTESVVWLKDLYLRHSETRKDTSVYSQALAAIAYLINYGNLLPPNYTYETVNADGVWVNTPDKQSIHLYELSEGIKSVLSLTFELLRLLVQTFGIQEVFPSATPNDETPLQIKQKGVVLIDEIDVHLHPTWQARIGQWFTQTFPNIQFIVATHSPLVCRSCSALDGTLNGSIWLLSKEKGATEIVGEQRDWLIWGDILRAYETDVFGDDIEQSDISRTKQAQYRTLIYKKNYGGLLTEEEQQLYRHLQNIFHSHVEID
jgi:energy-coupling factor transporter ATP-binding protein EcfA2